MKIAICDDEKYIRDFIAKSISDAITDAIVKCYESAENLLEAAYNPDILFLDIQMPGIDGMELAKQVRANGSD